VRCRWWEIGLLLAATFFFFRPDWVVDRFHTKYVSAPASNIFKVADGLKKDEWLILRTAGENIEGKAINKTLALPMGDGATGRDRIKNGGVTLTQLGSDIEIAAVKFGSQAKKLGVDQGYKILDLQLPNPARPSQFWGLIPAVVLAWLVWFLQGLRLRKEGLNEQLLKA
jgi:hypothetical protein